MDHPSGKVTAAEMKLSKINLVFNGQDADSVSTLGNLLSPRHLKKRSSTLLANPSPITTGASGASIRSELMLDLRVPAMEEQLSQIETNITKTMKSTLESFFDKLNQAT